MDHQIGFGRVGAGSGEDVSQRANGSFHAAAGDDPMRFQHSVFFHMRILINTLLAVIAAMPFAGLAQTADDLQAKAAADLQAATSDLTAVRAEIEAERLPLARKVS